MDAYALLDHRSLRWIWLAAPRWHPLIAAIVSPFTLLFDLLFSGEHNIFRVMLRLRGRASVAFSCRYHYYANRALYNYGWLLYSRPDRIAREMAGVHVVGMEHYQRALDGSSGVIVFSAHVGCFLNAVFCDRLIRRLAGRSLVLLSPANEAARKQRITEQMRDVMPGLDFGLIDIEVKTDAIKILRALRNRAVVACTLDYAYPYTKNTLVTFLGRRVEFPVGLVELGRKVGVTYLPCFAYVRNGRTTLEFMEPFASKQSEKREDDVAEVVAQINDALERKILAIPEQWNFWLRLYGAEPAPS